MDYDTILDTLSNVMVWVREEFEQSGCDMGDFLSDWGFTEELREYLDL